MLLTALLDKVQMDKQLGHVNATENVLSVAEKTEENVLTYVTLFGLVRNSRNAKNSNLRLSVRLSKVKAKRTWMTLFSSFLVERPV